MSRRILLIVVTVLTLSSGFAAASTAAAAVAPVDTIRTNLWVARALMTEILVEVFESLPADAPGIVLEPAGRHEALDLMQTVAYDLATERGIPVYLNSPGSVAAAKPRSPYGDADQNQDELDDEGWAEDDLEEDEEEMGVPAVAAAPYVLVFRLEDVEVEFPRAGRRLGLWRTWIDRECTVTAVVMLRDRRDGLILHDDQATRMFGDRFPAGKLERIAESSYEFNDATVAGGGGIFSILEEVVVLGSLAGLIAAYFATTAD